MSLCLLAGAMAPQLISFRPHSGLIVALLVALLVILPWCRRSDIVCLLAGGTLFMAAATEVIDSRLAPEYARESMLVTLKVVEFPANRRGSTTFRAVAISDRRITAPMRLSWFEAPVRVQLGDVWRLQIVLRRPRGNSNPGVMDTEAWLFRERIGATGYVVGGPLNELRDSGFESLVDRFRKQFLARIARQSGSDDSKAILAAIVVGARHRMSGEQWLRYARTGTSHLMAISGLHIGLATMGAYFLARIILALFAVRINHVTASLVFALLTAAIYVAISGFAVPSQRAVIMLCLTTTAIIVRRTVCVSRMLALAAATVLFVNSLSVLTPGFKLSFSAVALLFWFSCRLKPRSELWFQRPVHAVRVLIAMQFFLAFGLLPLTGLAFDRISLAAPFINLLAVPLFSLVTVPFALCGLVLTGPLTVVGDLAIDLALQSIRVIDYMIARAAEFQGSSHSLPEVSSIGWLYLLLPLSWVLLPPGFPGRTIAILGVAALLLWRPNGAPPGCLDATILDVGQGLAVVVETDGYVMLYDTGPSYRGGGTAAESMLLPFLSSRGIQRIDRIVVSHSDLDHAGGVGALVSTLSVGEIISGDPLDAMPTGQCSSKRSWRRGPARFTFLYPPPEIDHSGNNASCVLLIELGDTQMLLTGDIEKPAETQLVSQRTLTRVDIVTVPHHGSRTSSTAPFVQSLRPTYAIVSAAYGNQWGFPKSDVVARWEDAGAVVLNTATSGAIGFRLCTSGDLKPPREFRRNSRRLWHDVPQYADY
ncbi:MAG: DNA internalization-related competence protein ComEC/Rec2 [Woeseiaceae bacterium]|nr:DNA internalization-related competence protein ComEC/Rec2 [Woeseiaceae bacterium]